MQVPEGPDVLALLNEANQNSTTQGPSWVSRMSDEAFE